MDPTAPRTDTAVMHPPDPPSWEPRWPAHRPHRDRRRGGLVLAIVLTVLAFAAGLVASAFVELQHLGCCDAGALGSARAGLGAELLAVWLAAGAVPGGAAAGARSAGRRVWPWLAVAGVAVVLAGGLAMTAEPVYFCF